MHHLHTRGLEHLERAMCGRGPRGTTDEVIVTTWTNAHRNQGRHAAVERAANAATGPRRRQTSGVAQAEVSVGCENTRTQPVAEAPSVITVGAYATAECAAHSTTEAVAEEAAAVDTMVVADVVIAAADTVVVGDSTTEAAAEEAPAADSIITADSTTEAAAEEAPAVDTIVVADITAAAAADEAPSAETITADETEVVSSFATSVADASATFSEYSATDAIIVDSEVARFFGYTPASVSVIAAPVASAVSKCKGNRRSALCTAASLSVDASRRVHTVKQPGKRVASNTSSLGPPVFLDVVNGDDPADGTVFAEGLCAQRCSVM